MVRRRVLRTHLYLYIQAYAIKRPTLERRRRDFLWRGMQALEIKALRLDEISCRRFLPEEGFVTPTQHCAALGHSVTKWCERLGIEGGNA
ncbi:hypothetical protein PFWH6_0372 [Pseudomonas fluorescens WH6]|nr:hypothetical protein PFWH6_0372 [Pseudomonas fluorescens WH6]